jgi:hypothetical protein
MRAGGRYGCAILVKSRFVFAEREREERDERPMHHFHAPAIISERLRLLFLLFGATTGARERDKNARGVSGTLGKVASHAAPTPPRLHP